MTHHDRPKNIRSSWQAMWQHYDKMWQQHDNHVTWKITMILVLKLTQSNFYTEYYKQSQWILISWKLQIFCSAIYCLEMYFSNNLKCDNWVFILLYIVHCCSEVQHVHFRGQERNVVNYNSCIILHNLLISQLKQGIVLISQFVARNYWTFIKRFRQPYIAFTINDGWDIEDYAICF